MALGDGNRTLKEDAMAVQIAEWDAGINISSWVGEYKWILLLIAIVILYRK